MVTRRPENFRRCSDLAPRIFVHPWSKLKHWKHWSHSRIVLICVEMKCQLDATEVFYCRSDCLLNMFRGPLCPSSGAQEYYTVVAACGISCCGFRVVGLVRSWGLCVRFAGCCSILQTGHITLSSTSDQLLEETTARNTTGSNHCIILLSSWWWA